MPLSFKSCSFPLWQGCLFFAHTSLSFTFTGGVACNYCLVNSFFCNIHDVQRQQSSKRSRGRETSSILRMTNSQQGKKRKEKGILDKAQDTKYQAPTVPPSSVTHAIGGIVQVIPSCLWSHISATLFGSTVLFVKSFTVKVQLQILQSDFLDLQNVLQDTKAIIPSTESCSAVVNSLRIYWAGNFRFEFGKCFCIIFKEMYKLGIRN